MGEKKTMPSYVKYINGGLAGMLGSCFVQPLDLVKTRMQLASTAKGEREYKNFVDCLLKVAKNEGPLALYNGIGAGLLRQATYTTTRMGVYQNLIDLYQKNYGSKPTVGASMAMGIIAGAVGAFVGTPADMCLIRMMADGKLPPEQRRNYKNVFDALGRVVKEEGVLALWRGCTPTVIRAMVVNMAQLASYSQLKNFYKRFLDEGFGLHFLASLSSGFITCVASMPIDLAKTRIQNMKTVDGKPEYKGSMDVITKIVKREGVLALWKGFTPYFMRIGPHTILTLVFLENLNRMYNQYVLGEDGGSNL